MSLSFVRCPTELLEHTQATHNREVPNTNPDHDLLLLKLYDLYRSILNEREQYGARDRQLRARIAELESENAAFREELEDQKAKVFKLKHKHIHELEYARRQCSQNFDRMSQLGQDMEDAKAAINQNVADIEQARREHADCNSRIGELALQNRGLLDSNQDYIHRNNWLTKELQKATALFEVSENSAKVVKADLECCRADYHRTVKDCACLAHALFHTISQKYSIDTLKDVLIRSGLQPTVVDGLLSREGAFKGYIMSCPWATEETDSKVEGKKRKLDNIKRRRGRPATRKDQGAVQDAGHTDSGVTEVIDRDGDTIFVHQLSQ